MMIFAIRIPADGLNFTQRRADCFPPWNDLLKSWRRIQQASMRASREIKYEVQAMHGALIHKAYKSVMEYIATSHAIESRRMYRSLWSSMGTSVGHGRSALLLLDGQIVHIEFTPNPKNLRSMEKHRLGAGSMKP
jgi:hypothetical protein